MKGIREIRRRIKAVKTTAQITSAMQLVATSKMKRAQDAARAGRPYALLLAEILDSVLVRSGEIAHPFFQTRPVQHRGILVIGTDKGLCGPLNSNLFRQIAEIDRSARFVCVGRKASQFITRAGRELLADFSVSDRVNFSEVRTIVEYMIKAFTEGRIDTVEILFPRYINTLRQEPTLERLVPFRSAHAQLEELRKRLQIKVLEEPVDTREMIYEPSPADILGELPALFIKQEVYQMILDAKASEHSARMVAMKSATDNAKSLESSLTLEYNKARQAAITAEILEIASAAAAAGR